MGWLALMAPPGTPAPVAQQDQRRPAHRAGAARVAEALRGSRHRHQPDHAGRAHRLHPRAAADLAAGDRGNREGDTVTKHDERQQLSSGRMHATAARLALRLRRLSFAPPPAAAQSFPTAPVKLIVTTGAGGAPDVIARIVAEGLSRQWSQQVFVTNHPGAAGSIGMKVAGTSPADGYTLLLRAVVELRRAAGDRHELSLRPGARFRLDRLRLRAADGGRGAGLARRQHARRVHRLREEAARPGQRRGAEPRRHSASAGGMDQDGGQARHDLDQLSRHAGGTWPTRWAGACRRSSTACRASPARSRAASSS